MISAYIKERKFVMNEYEDRQKYDKILYLVLLMFYIVTSIYVTQSARLTGSIGFADNKIPMSAFTGVISSISNMSVILMVVYLRKPGFITAIVLILMQFPLVFISIFKMHNFRILPGLFSNILVLVVVIIIYRRNVRIEKYRKLEIDKLNEQQKGARRLFEQTATALVSAIDAKDEYSKGHSLRVATYSKKIAEEMGKDEDECLRIYYVALLHDVGKIGVADSILTKNGRLTDEEYEMIKSHSLIGRHILSGITEYPFISVGANYHHERYDGKGYPEHLKGEEIPEVARIIAVADAYDAMTSNRSYRDAMPQQLAREEIVKEAGTQFDPAIARIMQHLIDIDTEFEMKEKEDKIDITDNGELRCDEYRSKIAEGVLITSNVLSIDLKVTYDEDKENDTLVPAMILFDSLDGNVHCNEKEIKELNYFEYAEIWFDGKTVSTGARKIETHTGEQEKTSDRSTNGNGNSVRSYNIEAVRYKDHALIKIRDAIREVSVTVALPDSTRYAYIGLTGEHCVISDINITRSEKSIEEDYIKRIAPKISYIDRIEGDIPNIQIDGFRTDATKGIPVTDGLEIKFHTMSLPTARLIWHCPYIVISNSSKGVTDEKDYTEYALIRLDGEMWESDDGVQNNFVVEKRDSFSGWDNWKDVNKKGFECTISFERKNDRIIVTTTNMGIYIKNTTFINSNDEAYVVLTGDQCALTHIRIK